MAPSLVGRWRLAYAYPDREKEREGHKPYAVQADGDERTS